MVRGLVKLSHEDRLRELAFFKLEKRGLCSVLLDNLAVPKGVYEKAGEGFFTGPCCRTRF